MKRLTRHAWRGGPAALGFMCWLWAASGAAAPLEAVYGEAAAGVVLVLAGPGSGGKGPVGRAQAGFVVSPEGKILTGAAGVLNPDGREPWGTIYVYTKPAQLQAQAEGNLVNRYRAQVIASAPTAGLNLALLQLEDAPPHLVPLVFGDASAAATGGELVAIGHPEAAGLWAGERIHLRGRIDNFAHVPGQHVLLFDRGLSFGQWGGPVLDAAGRVLGMVLPPPAQEKGSRRRPASTPGGLALTSTAAVGWLAQNNMALAAPGAPPGDDPDSASDNPTPQPSTVAVDGPPPNAERARRQATEAAAGSSEPVVVAPPDVAVAAAGAAADASAPASRARAAPASLFLSACRPYSLHQILRQQLQSPVPPIPAAKGAAPTAPVPHRAAGDTP